MTYCTLELVVETTPFQLSCMLDT